MTRFQNSDRPTITWEGWAGRPAIGMTITDVWHGAAILLGKGKEALRDFTQSLAKWPDPASPEGLDLSAGIAELTQYWRDEIAYGWSLADMADEDPARYDDADRIVIGWLGDAGLPSFRTMCLELAWPLGLWRCTRFAEENLATAEAKFEADEVASYRVRRWLEAVRPFEGRDWLPRGEMFATYCNWCRIDGASDKIELPRDFYAALRDLGCQEAGRKGVRGFRPGKGFPKAEYA